MSKSKVIESNDASKSDPKDARIIFRLARDKRTLTVSDLSAVYEQMRIVNRSYEKECLLAMKEGGGIGTLHLSHVHVEGLETLVANGEQVACTVSHQVEMQTGGGQRP